MWGYALLFFIASFVGFLAVAERGNPIAGLLCIAVPAAGVYWLGWVSLLTFLGGFVFGGYLCSRSRRG